MFACSFLSKNFCLTFLNVFLAKISQMDDVSSGISMSSEAPSDVAVSTPRKLNNGSPQLTTSDSRNGNNDRQRLPPPVRAKPNIQNGNGNSLGVIFSLSFISRLSYYQTTLLNIVLYYELYVT